MPEEGYTDRPTMVIFQEAGLIYSTPNQREKVDIEKLVGLLNKKQSTVFYRKGYPDINLAPPPMDLAHGYTKSQLYGFIAKKMENSDGKAILICSQELEQNVFNHHNARRGFGVITIENYENYIPKGTSLTQYLAYLVLCETLCLLTGLEEHKKPNNYCLFDWCVKKGSLIESIRLSYICRSCEAKINSAGISQNELTDLKNLLKYTRQPNFLLVLESFFKNWLVSIPLGFSLGVFSKLLTNVSEPIAGWIAGAILALLLLALVAAFVRAIWSSQKRK